VPHGSVLGQILFLLYTADVLQLVKSHQLQPHAYADDTQICGSCRPSDVNILQECVADCINEVSTWMMVRRLQFNPVKTEVLWCSSARRRHQIQTRQVRVGNSAVLSQSAIRHLGSTSTLTSPCLPTSPRPSEPVLLHYGRDTYM